MNFAPRLARRLGWLTLLWLLCGCQPAADSTGVDSPPLFSEVSLALETTPPGPPDADYDYFLPDIMGPGVALLDFDGDGDLDILLPRKPPPGQSAAPAPNQLFAQQANGRFQQVDGAAGLNDPGFGQGVAVGDIKDDGTPDVFFANYGADALYLGSGDGRFEKVATDVFAADAWSSSAVFCDYDGDSDLDLYVARYLRFNRASRCPDHAGRIEYCAPKFFPGLNDSLFRNEGGEFIDVSEEAGILLPDGGARAKGLGVVCGDFDRDGRPDFYVANDGEHNQLWRNTGDGRFRDEALVRGVAVNAEGAVEASMGIAAGDVDRDGDLDLFLTHFKSETNTLYLSVDGGRFNDYTFQAGMAGDDMAFTGWACGLLDIDHDGNLDLAVVNGRVDRRPGSELEPFWSRYAEPNLLFLGKSAATYASAGAASGPFATRLEVTRGLGQGDLDGDGDLDMVVTSAAGKVWIYRNERGAGAGHSLQLRVVDGKHDALGASVLLRAGDRISRHLVTTAGYLSSSDPRIHIGLGDTTTIDEVEVTWTDGSNERFVVDGTDAEHTLRRGYGEPR